MMRIALFLLTNLSIIVVFGILLKFTGVKPDNVQRMLILSLLFGFGGSFVSLLISKWMALRSVNGKIIEQPTSDIELWLINIVSRLAKSSRISIPQIAIYDALDMNAFATGARRNSSLIAVSTGLLNHMNRDEIEAVIAHEISHIANGDMVTMSLIQGIVNTFVIFISRIVTQIFITFFNDNKNEDEEKESNNNSLFIYGIIVTVLETIFGILASIITMWFSRHREFHADAGSARMVSREKMISALQRLKDSYEPQEDSSLITFCINGKSKKNLSELFMTHPSLDKRIKVLREGYYLK